MQGTKEEPGIIPRSVEALFERQLYLENYTAELAVSYMEIYKDEVYDLLVARDNVCIFLELWTMCFQADVLVDVGPETSCARKRCRSGVCRQLVYNTHRINLRIRQDIHAGDEIAFSGSDQPQSSFVALSCDFNSDRDTD